MVNGYNANVRYESPLPLDTHEIDTIPSSVDLRMATSIICTNREPDMMQVGGKTNA